MADKNQISVPSKVMYQDCAPENQPKGTYRSMWNGVKQADDGAEGLCSNENANFLATQIPDGYVYLGSVYMSNGVSAIWSTNPITNKDEIGLFDTNDAYVTVVNGDLGFDVNYQIDPTFRLRHVGRTVYWVDGNNNAMTFNFDKVYQYYTSDYKEYLSAGGDPASFTRVKWDFNSFQLIKVFEQLPTFNDVEILNYGNMYPGSYSFAIQYLDEDLNPTYWVTTSNAVRIFNDTIDKPYHRIRGSRNTQNDSQSFGKAPKSIKLEIGNLDTNYPFYRVAVIEAINNTGRPSRAIGSNPISTYDNTFIFSGNEENYSEVPLTDILLEPALIIAPKHIEQLEKKMLLANGKGAPYNWCDFQQYASKITSDLVTKEIILNSVESEANQKNGKSTFMFRGYMPGEVYSFAVVYLLKGGIISPAFHIPGKHSSDTVSKMLFHESERGNSYLKIHDCGDGKTFWGKDATGHSLTGANARHHRFPFRNTPGVDKPLITATNVTTTITKWKLSFRVTLDSLTEWPTDTSGNPLIIPYSIQYKPTYSPSPLTYTGYLTIDDLSDGIVTQDIVIYDDIDEPDFVSGSDYMVFVATSPFIVDYVDTNKLDYSLNAPVSYVADTIQNTTTSEIFGISFSGIEKPHPDVIGFYIVRQERLDDDRIVLDNAIIGHNIKSQQYRGFGLLMPKVEDSKKDERSTWFFSPEHQFFKKKLNFTDIVSQGTYTETSKDTYKDENHFDEPGVTKYRRFFIVEDVYPGTSYSAEVHKKNDKDDDGFSLAISYRNFNTEYEQVNSSDFDFPNIEKSVYLDACASKLEGADTYYNVSCDNKIGIIRYDNNLNLDFWKNPDDLTESRVVYGSLINNNKQSYADFLTRVYYKEHNNPVLFGDQTIIDDVRIFNGDSEISPFNFVSTVFWEQRMGDFDKKNRTWQIVAGAVLIVVGVILAWVGVGIGLTVVGAGLLAAAAISYGVSLAMSGIKFEQMKSMIDNDYPKGLKDIIKDQDTTYMLDGEDTYPGPLPPFGDDSYEVVDDDAFIWHSDRLSNIWIESSIPAALRVGVTASTTDFVDAPAPQFDGPEFVSYLTEKLTVMDRDRGSGRLYKGYPMAEVYDTNLDFSRFNKEKFFYALPIQYNCCNKGEEDFEDRVWYSQESFQEEKTDNYRVFLPNNYRDIDGENGPITDLYKIGNRLFIHTSEALYHLPVNYQERVTGELITFIGTGEFFSIPPIPLTNDSLGGTEHKWASVKTPNGVMFTSERNSMVFFHTGEKPIPVSNIGMETWFNENLRGFFKDQFRKMTGVEYPNDNNPANPNAIGIHSIYDKKYDRVIITKRDYLLLPQYNFILLYNDDITLTTPSLDPGIPVTIGYNTVTRRLTILQQTAINSLTYAYYRDLSFDEKDYFENKSWTISYSFDDKGWKSFHSYLPLAYIKKGDDFCSMIDNKVWMHNEENRFLEFYGTQQKHILEYVSVADAAITKTWTDLVLNTFARSYDSTAKEYVEERFITFNRILFSNKRQCSGYKYLVVKDETGVQDYMYQQVVQRLDEILINRTERDWTLNDIRDYRINYNVPIFTRNWGATRFEYPIDKVLNSTAVDINKDWTQIEVFRDKYLVVRLEFYGYPNVSLTTNYIIDSQSQSIR